MFSIFSRWRRRPAREEPPAAKAGGSGDHSRSAGPGAGDESPERRPVDNRDIQAAWYYHNGTKHPSGYLMDPGHWFDPADRPLLFKRYAGPDTIPLQVDASHGTLPVLEAIAVTPRPGAEAIVPDVEALGGILHFSAGITKRIRYPDPVGEIPFRAAACTGALYHVELYLVCGALPGLEAGVYHYDPEGSALRRLREGDYRSVLVEATGGEPAVAQAPAILIYTDVFWRNAYKYQAREYRHAFWDSGTIIANTLAMGTAEGLPAQVVAGFVDAKLNRLLDLDTTREFSLALIPIGRVPGSSPDPAPQVDPLPFETALPSDQERDFPAIRAMHAASTLKDAEEAAAWRGEAPSLDLPTPEGALFALEPFTAEEIPREPLEQVIVRRGSARRFTREPISFRQLSTILQRALQGVPADFLEPGNQTLNHLYLIVNAVEGLSPGAYVYHPTLAALELLEEGNFRAEAGALALHQELAADAAVAFFFLSSLEPVLERFGNRGYRAAQLDAGIAGGRVYLAAYALQLGATGLTFFDDAVTGFFSPHAAGKSVMFLVAVGRPARRR